MPWRLIAKAFGWRAATDEDGIRPVLVVWHPRLKRHFSGDDAWKRAVRLSVHAPESTAVFAPGKAKEDDSMIEPMQQRMLQARMETAEGDTRRRLRIIERQIVSRAERMTVTDRVKRRQPRSRRINLDARRRAAIPATCCGAHTGPSWRNRRSDAQARAAGAGDRRVAIAPEQSGGAGMTLRPGGPQRCGARPAKAKRAGLEKVGRSSRADLGSQSSVDPWPSLPRFVLRSEPAAVRFKGKSRAIGGRRLDMGGRVLRRPEGPLVRTPPMLALAAAAP